MDGPSLAPPLAPDKMTHQFPPENRLGAGNTALHSLFIQNTGQGIQNASTFYSEYRAGNTALHSLFIQNTRAGIIALHLLFIQHTGHSTAYNVPYTEYRAGNTELHSALYSPYNAQYNIHCALLYTEYRAGNTEPHSNFYSPYNVQNTLLCKQIFQKTGQGMLYLQHKRQEIQSQVYYTYTVVQNASYSSAKSRELFFYNQECAMQRSPCGIHKTEHVL
jgi:hypothetical protein